MSAIEVALAILEKLGQRFATPVLQMPLLEREVKGLGVLVAADELLPGTPMQWRRGERVHLCRSDWTAAAPRLRAR